MRDHVTLTIFESSKTLGRVDSIYTEILKVFTLQSK
jgi:hypothetical protein